MQPTPEPDRLAPSSLLVVGSGPAGLAAATAFRDAGGTGPVRIVTGEDRPPYFRPPLSKEYLRGESGADELALEDDGFYADRQIELLLGRPAAELDPARRLLTLSDGSAWPYRHCVLATGSDSSVPPFDGADHPDVALLRSFDEGRHLRERATTASTAVVVGSGFIGCEAAVSLARRGLDVTVVSSEQLPQAARLGERVGRTILGWLQDERVDVRTGVRVGRVEDGHRVVLEDGARLDADLVLLATGAVPRTALAEAAGLRLEQGRVVTDEQLRTSADGVLAAGDIAYALNPRAGRRLAVEHWGDAEQMGTVAGTVAAGGGARWDTAPGFFSVIGDRTLMYAAWGDGFDEVRVEEHPGGAFTAWYGTDGRTVGVCAHQRDADYERGRELVERGAPLPGGAGGRGRPRLNGSA